MHSHGSFASLPLIWYWEYTRNATFLTDATLATADPTATPYALVRGLAEWWVCHLTKEEAPTAKDGYIFSDLDDCAYERERASAEETLERCETLLAQHHVATDLGLDLDVGGALGGAVGVTTGQLDTLLAQLALLVADRPALN